MEVTFHVAKLYMLSNQNPILITSSLDTAHVLTKRTFFGMSGW